MAEPKLSLPEMPTEREQMASALAWCLRNLREAPEAIDGKGHPLGWVPDPTEIWEQNREAAGVILLRTELGPTLPEPRDVAPDLFVDVGEAPKEGNVQIGGTSPLHARVRRRAPPAPEECLPSCRACAAEREGATPQVVAAPPGTAERAAQLGMAGVRVEVDGRVLARDAAAARADEPAPMVVCANCLGQHGLDDCHWTTEGSRSER